MSASWAIFVCTVLNKYRYLYSRRIKVIILVWSNQTKSIEGDTIWPSDWHDPCPTNITPDMPDLESRRNLPQKSSSKRTRTVAARDDV